MKFVWHLPWLLCSLVASVFIIRALDPFAGMGTGMLIATLLCALAVSHLIAGVIGLLLTQRTWWRAIPVVLVALVPTLLFSIEKGEQAWSLRYRAPYDRFRENLLNPIPASVTDLRFISYEESDSAELMFRFNISPEDLDHLIRSKGFTQINTADFRQPNDLFILPEYLPLTEPTTYYIIDEIQAEYPGKGVGGRYTLKVSADRKHVIFRKESADYYLYEYWQSDIAQDMTRQFVNSLGTRAAEEYSRLPTTRSVQ